MERKLASIQIIKAINLIPDADKIEVATVLDWDVVVKKGEFKAGDKCVYIEIDSVLPSRAEFEFMRERKFRVRTIKLRGQISQGLVMPLIILPSRNFELYKEGQDVAEILGITKYESPEEKETEIFENYSEFYKAVKNFIMKNSFLRKHLGFLFLNQKKGGFPTHIISKTDEERIQNLPWIYEYFKDRKFYVTQKMDGTSATFGLLKNEYMVCTRNNKVFSSERETFLSKLFKSKKQRKGTKSSYIEMSIKYDIEKKLRKIFKETGKEYFIQGEICGPSIQKNKMGLKEKELFVFNVYDVQEKRYLEFYGFTEFCEQLNLQTVPIIPEEVDGEAIYYEWNLEDLEITSFEKLMKISEEQEYSNKTPSEGIVVRTIEEENIPKLGRFSFKVISNKFLLKYGL